MSFVPYIRWQILLATLNLVHFVACGEGGFLEAIPEQRALDFVHAMESVMGCGGAPDSAQMLEVERELSPLWRVLPKNQKDRIEWRMLRYAAHRYFLQRSSLLVRGFEPASSLDGGVSAQIIDTHAPPLMQQMLEGKAGEDGFSFEEAVSMIGTLERLIADAEVSLIHMAFDKHKHLHSATLTRKEVEHVLVSYVMFWMVASDPQTLEAIKKKPSLMYQVLPRWDEVQNFALGIFKNVEYFHQRAPSAGFGHIALAHAYTFSDVHKVISKLTRDFAHFWETECQAIKDDLVSLDKDGTGRVSLKDFYGANHDGNWRYGESEAYLRELGALDESSATRGKQVIIPNYVTGASNCIIATSNYLVCCVNECESVLSAVEDTVGSPLASPDSIVSIVGTMGGGFDDKAWKLDKGLISQLGRISETHGGLVPLHGRLFAQWLHYVFPRDCPFPHRAGSTKALSPAEYGDEYIAQGDDIARHAHARFTDPTEEVKKAQADAEWMAQWSEVEELQADYSVMQAPWERGSKWVMYAFFGVALLLILAGVVKRNEDSANSSAKRPSGMSFNAPDKAHFV